MFQILIFLLLRLHEQSGDEIPLVMKKCVEYLTEDGLSVLGIFRRTPSQFLVQEVKKKFNSGLIEINSDILH